MMMMRSIRLAYYFIVTIMIFAIRIRAFRMIHNSRYRRADAGPSSSSMLRFSSRTEEEVVNSSRQSPQEPKTSSSLSSIFPTVTLKRTRQSKRFRNGSLLVFTRAIDQTNSENLRIGDFVRVAVKESNKNKNSQKGEGNFRLVTLGFGVFNPNSLYRVRMLCHRYIQRTLFERIENLTGSEDDDDAETKALELILNHHFTVAMKKRRALDLPNDATDTYRLVNGEGDSVSGLAVDIIGGKIAVVMSSAAWVQIHKQTIIKALETTLPEHFEIVWKMTTNRIEQDGYKVGDDKEEGATSLDKDDNHDQVLLSKENGILYNTYPRTDGQKTGVYCDQRENRYDVAQLCKGKRVLDLCCYHGGFALNALVNGNAVAATAVDSSEDAIKACAENGRLNNCRDDELECITLDITTFLQESYGDREYDVVVLDPPKLAPSTSALEKARRKYHGLNRDAIKIVSKENGGLLLTCTCSAAMTQKDGGQYFLETVHGAALAAGRCVTLMRVSGAAGCHTQSPIAWPAGTYLTAALFYVHPVE